jgi:hypothetical protein
MRCSGYVQLAVAKCHPNDHDHFAPITKEGERSAILKSTSVAPWASSLFRHQPPIAAGILMETTWRIIRVDVPSILTVVAGNVGIPIALNFGPMENCELYDRFSSLFESSLELDLSTNVIELDQGAGLRSITVKYGNQHLACLRHLFVAVRVYHSFMRSGIL